MLKLNVSETVKLGLVTISNEAKPKDHLGISIAHLAGEQYATDWIEYDIAFSPNLSKRFPYYSTLEGNNTKPFVSLFKPGTAIDQHGRDQVLGHGIADGKSTWEHRIIGLAGGAPGALPKHGIVFTGGKGGTYTVYLDNLRLRRADGSTTTLWASSKDTQLNKVKESEFFKSIQVRAVNASEVRQ